MDGSWAIINENWNKDDYEYRNDYIHGERGSGTHTHEWYEVKKNGKVSQGKVETNERTGSHTRR